MTYNELINKISILSFAYEMDFTVATDDNHVTIKSGDVLFASISNILQYYMKLNHRMFMCLGDNLRHDLLKIVYEFTQTPIDSRLMEVEE